MQSYRKVKLICLKNKICLKQSKGAFKWKLLLGVVAKPVTCFNNSDLTPSSGAVL